MPRATVERIDDDHGNVLPRYEAMGKPLDPTSAQVEQLNRETALPDSGGSEAEREQAGTDADAQCACVSESK